MWENIKHNKSGNYIGRCINCGEPFVGEKRDFICDDCKLSDEQARINWEDYSKRWDDGVDLGRD